MRQIVPQRKGEHCRLDMGQLSSCIYLTYMEESYRSVPPSSSEVGFMPHAADSPPKKGRTLQTRYGAVNLMHISHIYGGELQKRATIF